MLDTSGNATLQGGNGSFTVNGTGVQILSSLGLLIQAVSNATIKAGSNASIQSGANASVLAGGNASLQASGLTTVKGSTVALNDDGQPIARLGDQVVVGGFDCPCFGTITTGSSTVLGG